jgi:N-carbamoylputrescine amidase
MTPSTMRDSYSYTPSELVANFQTLLNDNRHRQPVIAVAPKLDTVRSVRTTTAETTAHSAQTFKVAAIQLTSIESADNDVVGFLERAVMAVKQAAKEGATLILLPELFMGPYFCQSQDASLMSLATEINDNNFVLSTFQQLAMDLKVVLPISIFERANNVLYNSVIMYNSDGRNLGTYRKSHIPDGTGYQEKFFFSPGDSGFQVFSTAVGRVGVGICWDQWFPEAARTMALMGADILLYPTAIGSEPQDPTLDSSRHWQRVMQGHAAANVSCVPRQI